MPIQRSKTPWIFIPAISAEAGAGLIQIFGYMQNFYLAAYGCPENSYVWVYAKEIKEKLKVDDYILDRVCEKFNNEDISIENALKFLNNSLTGSRAKNYCKDAINTMALHISNQANDKVVTNMLNSFLDQDVEHYIR